jgi:hypothetical protein
MKLICNGNSFITTMKNRSLLVTLLLLPAVCCFSQQDTCKVGLYINSLYDLRLENKTFMTDFWLWQTYKNDSLHFEDAIEVPNGKSVEFSHFSKEEKAGLQWIAQKCKAEIKQEWDLSKFPFDRQILRIEIEDSKYDASGLIYIADTANSRIDTTFNSREWCIERFSIKNDVRTYETTYGDPTLSGKSAYPRIVAEIQIRRNNSWRMLGKMLTGAYVAFLISCLVFFVSSENQDSRFGLCVGGLFAAIGNKYIVESIVPSSTINTLMDNVHNLTFTFILVIVGIIIISLHLFESGDERKRKLSLKLDKWSFFGIMTIFAVANLVLILQAIH